MAPLQLVDLPNELLHGIRECLPVDSISEFAALAQMSRRFNVIASPYLYAAAAQDKIFTHLILSIAAESDIATRSLRLTRLLLENRGNPNPSRMFPVLRGQLNSALAAQGRALGRTPLMDSNFRLECAKGSDYRIWESISKGQTICHGHEEILALAMCHCSNMTEIDCDDYSKYEEESFTEISTDGLFSSRCFWSPLHIAAHRGDNELVELLLAHGANVDEPARGCCDSPTIFSDNDSAMDFSCSSLHENFTRSHPCNVPCLPITSLPLGS